MNPKTPARVLSLAFGLLVAFAAGSSSGAIVVSADDISLVSSTSAETVSVEFFLDLTGPDEGGSLSVLDFDLEFSLTPGLGASGVSIIGVGETVGRTQARLLDTTFFDASTANASTANLFSVLPPDLPPPFVLNDGAGLARVDLRIEANSSGSFTLELLTGADESALVDPNAPDSSLIFSVNNPSVSISAVPEPTSLGILGAVSIAAAFVGRRRTNRNQIA